MKEDTNKNAQYWIEKLGLSPHVEGGYWAQTYRSEERIAGVHLPERFAGARVFSSAIYYLLHGDEFSALHRIKSDELWHFYAGSSLTLFELDDRGNLMETKLGRHLERGERPQAAIRAGRWFGAALEVDALPSYSLVGCTVSPGFEYEDFELGERRTLIAQYPQHHALIERLTR